MRNYEVYRLLEESMKAMLTSLPLVQVGPHAPVLLLTASCMPMQAHGHKTTILRTRNTCSWTGCLLGSVCAAPVTIFVESLC